MEVETKLDQADIVVLFLSADYLRSDHCFEVELRKARDAHESDRARVLHLRLRPVDAGALWFTELTALPVAGGPLTPWTDPEDAWAQVARHIAEAAREISERRG